MKVHKIKQLKVLSAIIDILTVTHFERVVLIEMKQHDFNVLEGFM